MIKIVIPDIPSSMNVYNGRKNVWKYRKDKQDWKDLVMWIAKAAGAPDKPYQKAVVHITYFFPTKGRRDPDNYSGKFILDGLTAAGVVADDSFGHIDLLLSGDYDKESPRTEVEVIEEI